jgi:glycine/D-amino acid oxidase-like deaminating enzyme/nitrite reductase/ring-hydroxylating ferredoxin subunit
MIPDSGYTISVWMNTADVPEFGPLEQDATCDVCIVGAGIAGLSVAYFLSREGRRVVVLDDGPISGGETSRTTAHLAFYIDDGLERIRQIHGEENLRLHVESHRAAVDAIERVARTESIDCDFTRLDGYLFVSPNGDGQDYLDEELRLAHQIGWTEAQSVELAPLPFDSGRALRFPQQGQFHPLKYLTGLARAIQREGGRIHSFSHVEKIESDSSGTSATITTSGGHNVTAKQVVVATNTPVNDMVAIHTKQAPYRTFAIGARIPRGSVTPALFWDTEEPYHYVRVQSEDDYDVLIVGGEDHKTGHYNDPVARFTRLEQWTRERFPMVRKIECHWSGQVMEPVDGVAFIGRNPGDAPNVFIATGDSGMGMTHGTIAGLLLTDLICDRTSPWEKLYEPGRVRLSRESARQFIKENVDVAVQYKDLLTRGARSDPAEIALGSGGIVRRGATKIAVYKDEAGLYHECSAICPHMGCVVQWNDLEKSWDCPCHGSRFDPFGRVINGPANSDLPPMDGRQRTENPGVRREGYEPEHEREQRIGFQTTTR